jgi:sulfite exporter TauE/SafE
VRARATLTDFVNQVDSMHEILAAAFLAGLMGSPHCIGMCGGFAAACARPRGSVWLWHAGRLSTYAAIGTIGGYAGAALPGPRWVPLAISAALLLWFALALADVVPQPKVRVPGLVQAGVRLAQQEAPLARYLFGAATGLIPCGMVYAALAIAVAAGHPAWGAAAMVAFGLGTVPALSLLSVGVQRFAARGAWHRRAIATLVLAAGLWSIGRRVERPVPSDTPAAVQHRH